MISEECFRSTINQDFDDTGKTAGGRLVTDILRIDLPSKD